MIPKHHRFTLLIAEGKDPADAYKLAGYTVKDRLTASKAASRLLKNVEVSALLKRIQEEAESKTVASVLERKQVLTKIIRGSFSQFMTADREIELTEENMNNPVLAEYKKTSGMGKDGNSPWESKTIKLRDPIAAIHELNDMEQIGKVPLLQDNRQWNIVVMSEETKALIGRINERLTDAGNERDNHD
jgi:Zn-dependent M16 (insulinase) family peptidase